MFNLADGLEHVKEMLNERVKTNKQNISQQKKEGKRISFFLMHFPLKWRTSGGRCRSICWAVRSEMLFLPPNQSLYQCPGLEGKRHISHINKQWALSQF